MIVLTVCGGVWDISSEQLGVLAPAIDQNAMARPLVELQELSPSGNKVLVLWYSSMVQPYWCCTWQQPWSCSMCNGACSGLVVAA